MHTPSDDRVVSRPVVIRLYRSPLPYGRGSERAVERQPQCTEPRP